MDRVRFKGGKEILLFFTTFRSDLGPIQPLIQWEPGNISPAVKRPESEADHSPPSSVEVKNGGRIPTHPSSSSWRRTTLQPQDSVYVKFF
jgi:hypothetical protein